MQTFSLAYGQLEVAGASAIGRRNENQDRWFVRPDLGLFAVADGVGGLSLGGMASELACQSLVDYVREGLELEEAVERIHWRLVKESELRGLSKSMATTLVAVRWVGDGFCLVWVGDSFAVTVFNQQVLGLTQDHSMVANMVEAGKLTWAEARKHPNRNVITQALGVSGAAPLRPGLNAGGLRFGERMILATDGLTENLTYQEIAALVVPKDTAVQTLEKLMAATTSTGTGDNATVIVARWLGANVGRHTMPLVYPRA